MMKRERGVTLIEVMVVVAIVGLLAAIAIPAYNNYITRSRRSDAFTALETVRAAQEMYRAERGFYAGAFVDGGNTVLVGCSSTMAGNNYTIGNLNRGNPPITYTIEATSKNNQAGDYSFRIDQDGNQFYNDHGTWKNDKKFEDLR